jgi:Cu/Zn superoxide dismutase/glucose/arabinose dehydrogenase
MRREAMHASLRKIAILGLLAIILPLSGLTHGATAQDEFPVIELPDGFKIEKMVGNLTYPTAVEWDEQGTMYVLEAGGQFLEEPPPSRIVRAEDDGTFTEVLNLTDLGLADSVVGMEYADGVFYLTHRDPTDRSGAVSAVTLDGTVTLLISGIVDSQSEHQVNDIQFGPDGRLYLASGPAGNAAVMGLDNAPFITRSPELHTVPCEDIVLTGQNFMTPDFRTADPSDTAVTGAYVPFGLSTAPGQTIEGNSRCGGAILVFDPADPEGTLAVYAWGFRNVIGFAWDEDDEMYAAVNGYDIRGSRPVRDEYDATYRIEEGAWYGWPDFSAALEPLTDPKFDSPDAQQVPVVVDGQPQGNQLGFVIDHEASGLEVADASLIAGLHEWNSSPSKLDVAPDEWDEFAGQLFVAEWGDLAPPTNPLREDLAGYQVVRVDPESGEVEPFVRNAEPAPASAQDAMGMGLERPFDVKFGPDGAMYIVDYGVARINPARAAEGQVPYEFPPNTGVVWRVTQTDETEEKTGTDEADETPAVAATPDMDGADEESTPRVEGEVTLRDQAGEEVATATFGEDEDGVSISVMAEGLTPGEHGIHVHERGECDPGGETPFTSAGGHFNPTGAMHGGPPDTEADEARDAEVGHAGDLGNIMADEEGTAELQISTDRFTLAELEDEDGSALVIHLDPDDLVTDPGGNSGERIVCGVVFAPLGTPSADNEGTPVAAR